MLSRMIYVSTAVGPVTTSVTGTILRSAQAHNAASGITGALCQGQGVYLQVLEGEPQQIEALYARILLDKRHQKIVLRQKKDISHRRYGNWSMAHIDMGQPSTDRSVFDPYTASEDHLIAKMDELIASGKVINAPVV